MGGNSGGVLQDILSRGTDDASEQEKALTAEQKMKKEKLEKQRIMLLRKRSGSLLDSMTDTGGRFLGE